MTVVPDEACVERVLSAVEAIPAGRVLAYGDVARLVGTGPRQVGRVLALYGGAVPWWRVVRADGRLATGHEAEARARLAGEGAPLRGDRVEIAFARADTLDRSRPPADAEI